MAQIIQPNIPYHGPIHAGIHEGKQIKITGTVPYGADRFTVNLRTGNCGIEFLDSESDHTLHISVRFKINTAVRNIYKDHSWGTEERNGPFPFSLGNNFTMVILVERSAYKISVNGQHCWDFVHRIPFIRARSLMIDGDVSVDRIQFVDSVLPGKEVPAASNGSHLYSDFLGLFSTDDFYPEKKLSQPKVHPPPAAPASTSSASSDPGQPLSYVFPIHGGMKPGMSIYISGRPTSNPYRFTINIQKGNAKYPPPDIAFHFDVRFFNYSVVRNTRLNDVWYAEESMISQFPFHAGNNFDVVIKVQSNDYAVTVNGKHFVSFRHRLNALPQFNVLSIENDVIITSIKYT